MERLTERMCEYICDNRCKYACDKCLTQEQLDAFCAGCKVNVFANDIKQRHRNEELKLIAHHYGYESQSRQLIEEMAELMVAINKLARMEKLAIDSVAHCLDLIQCKKNIAEEIADVEIMLDQLKYLLMNEFIVEDYKDCKIIRQLKRISKEQGNEHDT